MEDACLPQILQQDGLFNFFKRGADRSRRDIPYKEKNAKNLKIANKTEGKRKRKMLLQFLRGRKIIIVVTM